MANQDVVKPVTDEKHSSVVNDEASKSDVKTSDSGIILIPQPSNDPRDPLVSVARTHPL
jgi:hypothetical protein